MFRVTVAGSDFFVDRIRVDALLLPWAGESAGEEPVPMRRWKMGLESGRDWVYAKNREYHMRPDPGGAGVVGLESRCELPFFPLEKDGTSVTYPLLGSITSLALNHFEGEQIPALMAEIEQIMPHLTGPDAAAFAGFSFLLDEVRRVGKGVVTLTPL